MAGLHILVAEDNALNQRLALLLLQRLGHRAEVAATGPEVLERVGQQRFDVVLMDLHLPGMDGVEVTRQLQLLPVTPGRPRPRVIALTASVTDADREACRQAGMDGFLGKPLRAAELALALGLVAGEVGDAGGLQLPPAPLDEPVPSASSAVPIDRRRLDQLRLLAGDEGPFSFAALVRDHLVNSAALLETMRGAQGQGDTGALARAAHDLRSSAAMFGAVTVAARAAELEDAALDGASGRLPGALAELEVALRAAHRILEALAGAPGPA